MDRNISTAASNGSTLTINTAVPVTILNLTITGGKSDLYCGGIAITSGSVTLDSGSIITGNEATAGGGVSVGSGATLTCEYGNIKGNSAAQGGGVHLQSGGTFIMTDGTIGDTSLSEPISGDNCSNKATSIGGAIFGADGSTITLNGGTIAHNFGNNGGAVSSFGTLTVKNTIYGNNAYSCGGALYLGKPSSGETNFTLDDGAYLYDNVVNSSSGGAIYLEDASLTLNIKGEIYVPFLGVKQNDISLTYNSSTSTYSKINIAGELSKRNGCGANEPYITITPTGYHTDAVIVTESDENLRKQFCEKIGISTPSEEWPIWSVRPSNGKILDGYEISSSTYTSILTSMCRNGGKNVRLVYNGNLTLDDFSGVASKMANANDKIYLDFSEAIRDTDFTEVNSTYYVNRSMLVSIVFPNGITKIAGSCFSMATGLASVTLPADLVILGDVVFNSCTALEEITIPSTVESIGVYTFKGSGIKSISIPASVSSISSASFDECTSLTSATFEYKNWTIGSTAYDLSSKTPEELAGMLTNHDLGNWVKSE